MTFYHITFIDYSEGQMYDTTVRHAPSYSDAVLGALDKVPNKYYDDPIIVVPQYLH